MSDQTPDFNRKKDDTLASQGNPFFKDPKKEISSLINEISVFKNELSDQRKEAYSLKEQQKSYFQTQGDLTYRIRTIEKDLKLIRDQIDIVQIQVSERGRKWYLKPSILVSILALIISAYIGLISLEDQRKGRNEQLIKAKKDELRVTLSRLLEQREKNLQLSSIIFSALKSQQDVLINTNRQILIEDAKSLLDDLGLNASANSANYLGYEIQLDGDYLGAENYFLLAKAITEKKMEKDSTFRNNIHLNQSYPVTFRSLANLYMLKGTPIRDTEKGRTLWKEINIILKKREDENGFLSLGVNYTSWALAENYNGNKELALSLLDSSRIAYECMDKTNPVREQQLIIVDQNKRYIQNPKNEFTINMASRILGEWVVGYPDKPNLYGRARFSQTPNSPFLSFYIDIKNTNSNLIVRRLQGQGYLTSRETIRLDWNSQTPNPQNAIYPIPSQGSSNLNLSKEAKFLRGEEIIVGQTPRKVVFKKSD
ncbi:MAG: hypothetical protein AAF824_21975 [Bacteroidota bacterium]